MHEDDRLKRVLNKWEVGRPGQSLDERVLAAYRSRQGSEPWWRRSITVPVPLLVGLLLVAIAVFVWRPQERPAAPRDRSVRTLVAESSEGASYKTVGDFSGFVPAKEPVVTIERRTQ